MAIDGTQEVTQDLPCVRCGYNLRTLGVDGRCPECGADVRVTLELGGELQRARPAYIQRLAVGCWMLVAARVGMAVFALASAIVGYLNWLIRPSAHALREVLPVLAVACILHGLGSILLTTREHPRLPPELPRSRRALQICALGVLAGGVLMLVGSLPVGTATPIGIPRALAPQILWTATVLYCVCPVWEMRLLVRLSRRVGDGRLHEHAIIAAIGAMVSGLIALVVLPSRPGITSDGVLYVLLAILVAVLLFWIWTGYVSFLAASHLTRSWRAAAKRWEESASDHA